MKGSIPHQSAYQQSGRVYRWSNDCRHSSTHRLRLHWQKTAPLCLCLNITDPESSRNLTANAISDLESFTWKPTHQMAGGVPTTASLWKLRRGRPVSPAVSLGPNTSLLAKYCISMAIREKLNRKPSIFSLNMGLSCRFSLKPIHW